jgi:hypothetical protein
MYIVSKDEGVDNEFVVMLKEAAVTQIAARMCIERGC